MIVIVGTLDTKGDKIAYLKQLIEKKGNKTLVVDCGVLDEPLFKADISREEVAKAAGKSITEIRSLGSEAEAIKVMTQGASKVVAELYSSGKLEGLLGAGGTMATSIFMPVADLLPVGVPKVFFATTAFSNILRPGVVPPDLIVIPAVSNIWGISSLTKRTLENAAGAILGATQMYREGERLEGKNFVAITTLGTSELKYIVWLKPRLEKMKNEVLAFHIGGGQGWIFEHLIRQGMIKGVLDMCFMDLCPDNMIKAGFLSTVGRLEAAGERGIPQVIAPGSINAFIWQKPIDTLPVSFDASTRRLHIHNELSCGFEKSLEEIAQTAEIMATKINKSRGPRAIVIPKLGFSEFDKPGYTFHNPERSKVFTQALMAKISPEVTVVELDLHINDQTFAEEVAKIYSSMVKRYEEGML